MVRTLLAMRHLFQLAEERGRRPLLHLLPGGAAYGTVGGDEADDLRPPMLRGESLEHRVGVLRVPHLQRPVGLVRPGSVEDEVTARPFERHEAGELVTELPQVLVAPGVQEVVAVEEIERGLSHRVSSPAQPRWRFAS